MPATRAPADRRIKPPRRVLVIANPVSGGGRGGRRAAALVAALAARGVEVEQRTTTPERNGRRVAQDLRERDGDGFDALAVVGGDGSVHDVINGLGDLELPLAVLPSGTANVWAQDVGLPRAPAPAADAILGGHVVDHPLASCGERRFFLFAGIGLDARIVHRVEAVRARSGGRGGKLQWLVPGVREFFGEPLADLSVVVPGQPPLEHLAQVLVTLIPNYAGPVHFPSIGPAARLLQVLCFPARSKWTWLRIMLAGTLGRLRPGRDYTQIETAGPVQIHSAGAPEPFHLDGGHVGTTPLDVGLTGRAIRLLVPAVDA
ncbi:MAG: diacylglycerol kinase family protein [Planctomycetota bacterium]